MGRIPLEAQNGHINGVTPGVKLWQAIETTPAAVTILGEGRKGPRRYETVKAYLTTPTATQKQLTSVAEVKSIGAVSGLIQRAVERVWPHLPEEVRTEFHNSPAEAYRARSGPRQDVKEANIRRGQQIREGTYTGKPHGRPRKNGNAPT